jgi:hypothetical protein
MPALPTDLFLYVPATATTFANLAANRVSLLQPSKFDDVFDTLSITSLQSLAGTTQQLFAQARTVAADPAAFDARYSNGGAPNSQFSADLAKRKALVTKLKKTRVVRLNEGLINQVWADRARGAGHAGLCLRFDTTKAPFSSAEAVTYGPAFASRVSLAELDVAAPPTFRAAFFEKADYYAHEAEWRITDDTGVTTLSYDPAALTRIHFGARARGAQANVKAIFSPLPPGSRPELYQLEAHWNRFPGSSFMLDSFFVNY